MSKTKRVIRTTAEAAAAPIGTIVVQQESHQKFPVASQKHGNDSWFIAYGWEGSTPDKDIRGEVLLWGHQKKAEKTEAPEESAAVIEFRDRAVKAIHDSADGLAWDESLSTDYITGFRVAADIVEGL